MSRTSTYYNVYVEFNTLFVYKSIELACNAGEVSYLIYWQVYIKLKLRQEGTKYTHALQLWFQIHSVTQLLGYCFDKLFGIKILRPTNPAQHMNLISHTLA